MEYAITLFSWKGVDTYRVVPVVLGSERRDDEVARCGSEHEAIDLARWFAKHGC